MLFLKRFAQTALISVLSCSAASATTITFSGLTTDRADFTTYSESNYTVASTSGTWTVNASNYGDPVPSIFDAATTSTVAVTRNVGTFFTFSGVDIGNYDAFTESYTITGYLLGSMVFTTTGALPTTGITPFVDYGTAYSGDELSRLDITLTGVSEANLDNIVVNDYTPPAATPEPESLTLMLTGLLGTAAVARRRLATSFRR